MLLTALSSKAQLIAGRHLEPGHDKNTCVGISFNANLFSYINQNPFYSTQIKTAHFRGIGAIDLSYELSFNDIFRKALYHNTELTAIPSLYNKWQINGALNLYARHGSVTFIDMGSSSSSTSGDYVITTYSGGFIQKVEAIKYVQLRFGLSSRNFSHVASVVDSFPTYQPISGAYSYNTQDAMVYTETDVFSIGIGSTKIYGDDYDKHGIKRFYVDYHYGYRLKNTFFDGDGNSLYLGYYPIQLLQRSGFSFGVEHYRFNPIWIYSNIEIGMSPGQHNYSDGKDFYVYGCFKVGIMPSWGMLNKN